MVSINQVNPILSRRQFLLLAGGAGAALALPACTFNPPLRRGVFPGFGDAERPYLGLATSLRQEYDYPARVEGRLPPELRGILYRNGPGLFERGGQRKRTLLDGDGMVQAFRFQPEEVRYRNRFVRTRRFVEEEKAGNFLYPSWSTQAPGGWWANVWPTDKLLSQAGITVYLRNNRLYAFDESSYPYELDPVTLATIGESRLGMPADSTLFSAHSKIDRKSGEWLLFGIQYGPKPRLHLTQFSADGSLKRHRAIDMPRNIYFHDFFVSDRHVIFNLQPVEIGIWSFLFGTQSMAGSLSWRPERGSDILVLERDGNSPPLWLSTDACFMWHSFNAWERQGEIVADFIGYANPDHLIGNDPVVFAVMEGRRGNYRFPGELRRYRIDPGRRTIRQEILDRGSYEWPRINDLHLCHPYRIGYVGKCRPGEFFWSIITRIDMESGVTANFDFGEGVYCSEPVFIPRPGHRYDPGDPREPGWLTTEVYDSHTRRSYLAVLVAERLEDGPLAKVHLNHHAPFSYHGFWQPAG